MAFCNTKLSTIVLPSSLTNIAENAFSQCNNLTTINTRAVNPPLMANRNSFAENIYNSAILYTPLSSVNSYKSRDWWNLFKDIEGNDAYNKVYDFELNGIYYFIMNESSVYVTYKTNSFISYSGAVTIPSSVSWGGKSYQVTGIGSCAFKGCTALTSVIIPETVTTISANAFNGCSKLSSLTIPKNVISIGSDAFAGCSGITQLIWNAKTCWTNGSLVTSDISNVTIGSDVEVLPANFAAHSKVSSISFPNTLREIGASAFEGCTGLTDPTLPQSLEVIGAKSFMDCEEIKNLAIPVNVKVIEDFAFKNAGLTEVTIGDSVTSIGDGAFSGCNDLKTVYFNAKNCGNFNYSDVHPFFNSPVERIIIGDKVEALPLNFANGCVHLLEISIGNSVSTISDDAFSGCFLLTDVVIPDAVTKIGNSAFYDCTGLESISCGSEINEIGWNAFSGCSSLRIFKINAIDPPTVGYNAFKNVPQSMCVYVPSIAIEDYEESSPWSQFEILPIGDGATKVMIIFPLSTVIQDYSDMQLAILNIENGEKLHYSLSNKYSYVFYVEQNSTWDVSLTNHYGDRFGHIENVEVANKDIEITFTSLFKPQNVTLAVKTPNGQDVTSQCKVSWLDENGELLTQGNQIKKLPAGRKLKYQVALPQELATAYTMPATNTYTVKSGSNNVICQLATISQTQMSGKVKDATDNQALYGATISAVQSFGGDVTKTITAKTDHQGQYSLDASSVPTTLTVAASGYMSQTVECDMTGGNTVVVPDVALSPITGAVINVNLTYTPAHLESEPAEVQNWYSDYSNVDYEVYNKTTGRSMTGVHVQYPQIVLTEDVNDGDVLELTATSRKDAFKPVKATVTIAEQRATATFNILEKGKVAAKFRKNINPSVVGTLYGADKKLVKSDNFTGETLTIDGLADGNYKLISMGKSDFFNAIYDMDQFAATGLQSGVDYAENAVTVANGLISPVNINEVPFLDETKLYYTGENTSFTVNKSNIVIGNYLTFRAEVDFKDAYKDKVNDVQVIVDLPESCHFYEYSVMVGSNMGEYKVEGNRVIIPLVNYENLAVRFCAIPTVTGDFNPSAFVQFKLNGKTITQPIGKANYSAEGLSINVPSTVAKTEITVSGTAIGSCDIDIFDNDVLIGHTTSLANGTWSTKCELNEPYNLSTHKLQAKITTQTGIVFSTEIKECIYDRYIIEPKTVTMSFYNGWMGTSISVLFDFERGTTTPSSYSFYTATDFTFVADLTNNDTTVVSGVTLYIHTDKNEIRELAASYDKRLDKWVAVSHFTSYNLPVNISISIHAKESTYADRGHFDLLANRVDDKKEEATQTLNEIDELEEAANAVDQQMAIDEDAFASLESQINAANDNDEMNQLLVQWLIQAGLESSIEDFVIEIPETVDEEYIQSLISKGQELLDSSDDTDYTEAVDRLIKQVEDALENDNRFDYIASLRSAQSDTITLESEEGTATIFRTTLDNFGDIPFEISDTVRMEMTDGSAIYIYLSNDDDVVIVDSLKNSIWYMNAERAALLFAKSPLRAKGDFVAAMNAAIRDLENAGKTVVDIALEWIKDRETERAAHEALKNYLEQQQAVLLGQNKGMKIRLNEIEKELQALTAPDVITAEEYFEIVDRDDMVKKLKLERQKVLRQIKSNRANINKLGKSLTKCSARIVAVTAIIGQLYELYNIGQGVFTTISYANEAIQDHGHWYSLINNILPCEADNAKAVALKKRSESNWSDIAWSKGYYPAIGMSGLMTLINGYMFTNKAARFVVRSLISAISEYVNGTAKVMFHNAREASRNWYPARYAEYRSLKCNKDKDPDDKNEPHKPKDPDNKKRPPLPPTKPVHDPSGFVYEGVPSNRLQGVTATCYYKETAEDMYGDTYEEVVLWDAEQYGQENPLLTDENGFYRWDVPVGQWQVKYEKEGYETTYSDWLPVPPPQLDVNIGMVQMRQPEVIKARAYPQAVEFEFDKFMFPESLTTENIKVVDEYGDNVSGSIELLNAEVDDPLAITSIRRAPGTGLTFASRVRFNADYPFYCDEVTLRVSRRVKSYADLEMNEDYEITLPVEYEMEKIVADSTVNVLYGDSRELTVTVLPPDASKGKTLTVRSIAPMIATTDAETYTLNNNGQAVITVHGDLPGMTSLVYGIDGYDLSAATLVNVLMESQMTVATPTATIATGSTVEDGTAVYLRCATEGATIYYTLDGSCPCDPTPARKVYDGSPIIINGTVTIKAMATAPDLYDSDVATFVYRVGSGLKGDVNGDGEVNIADVNALIDIIAGGAADADTRYRADVNGDGEVSIADINAVIDIILNPANNMRLKVNCGDLLHLDDVTMRPGDVRTLQVTLDRAARYSAVQCDLVLPAGLTLVDAHAVGANVMRMGSVDDFTNRVLNYSMNKLPFVGDMQPVMTFTVRADAALAPESEITLTHVVLADAANKAWRTGDCTARVNNATGITDVTATASRVWVEKHTLCIESSEDGTARIATVSGMVRDLDVKAGITRHELEPGIYVVILGGQSYKISVR